jgi:hypothetical protein
MLCSSHQLPLDWEKTRAFSQPARCWFLDEYVEYQATPAVLLILIDFAGFSSLPVNRALPREMLRYYIDTPAFHQQQYSTGSCRHSGLSWNMRYMGVGLGHYYHSKLQPTAHIQARHVSRWCKFKWMLRV